VTLAPVAELVGHATPRIATPARSTSTAGPKAAAVAQLAGLELMPWQQYALDRILEKDPDGQWTHSEAGVIVARGNGKTKLLAARILYGLLVEGEDILGVASNNRSVARELWTDVVRLFIDSPLARYVDELPRKANGQEELRIRTLDGRAARYRIAAANAGTRGFRASLLVVDEVRELANLESYAAVTGVQAGLPRRTQRVLTSTAGDADSVVLNNLRDRGRAAAAAPAEHPRLAWLEWSADPDLDLDNVEAWRQANPSLGYRVSLDMLKQEAAAVPENVFRTEYLNLWVEVLASAIGRSAWEAATDDTPLDRAWPAWVGVELSPSQDWAAAVLAARAPDGITHLRLLELADSLPGGTVDPRPFAVRVAAQARSTGALAVIGDKWHAAPILDQLDAARITTAGLPPAAMALATAAFVAGVSSTRVRHNADPHLAGQVLAAGTRPAGDGGRILSRRDSTGPIAAAVAAAAATYAATAPDLPTPGVIFRA
jgi:phage terminase large subunit-like protein